MGGIFKYGAPNWYEGRQGPLYPSSKEQMVVGPPETRSSLSLAGLGIPRGAQKFSEKDFLTLLQPPAPSLSENVMSGTTAAICGLVQ